MVSKMVDTKLREAISNISPSAIVFDNPSFDKSIVGISTYGNIIYNLEKMIDELSFEEGYSKDEAYEFIDYNTIRILDYLDVSTRPIILDTMAVDFE